MSLLDHLFFLIAAIAYPLVSFFSYRRLLKRIEAGEKVERKALYNSTALGLWLLFAVAIGTWAVSDRPWTSLGISLQLNGPFLVAVGLTLAGTLFLVQQLRQVRSMSLDELRDLRASAGDVEIILPRNGNELNRFYGVSISAGIVEEVVWRGYFFWYLGQFMPIWAAAAVSTIGFGVAHAYQGWANVPKIVLVGAAFAILYLVSGSVWLPMILHAIVDIMHGRLAYEVVNRTDMDDSTSRDEPAPASV